MFGRNMNKDPETVQLWKNKYEKLAKEYTKVKNELDAVKQYKEDYESLIESVAFVKKRYEVLLEQEEELYNSYKAELDEVLQIAKDD